MAPCRAVGGYCPAGQAAAPCLAVVAAGSRSSTACGGAVPAAAVAHCSMLHCVPGQTAPCAWADQWVEDAAGSLGSADRPCEGRRLLWARGSQRLPCRASTRPRRHPAGRVGSHPDSRPIRREGSADPQSGEADAAEEAARMRRRSASAIRSSDRPFPLARSAKKHTHL